MRTSHPQRSVLLLVCRYCLGKIAPHLSAETQKKVLISAFTRALRDPFGPARIAGLACLTHGAERFTAEECAQRVLPAAAPFAVDGLRGVREAALKCVQACLVNLRKFSDGAPDGAIDGTPDPRRGGAAGGETSAAGGAGGAAGATAAGSGGGGVYPDTVASLWLPDGACGAACSDALDS